MLPSASAQVSGGTFRRVPRRRVGPGCSRLRCDQQRRNRHFEHPRKASNVETVTFSDPRSTRPTYDRPMLRRRRKALCGQRIIIAARIGSLA